MVFATASIWVSPNRGPTSANLHTAKAALVVIDLQRSFMMEGVAHAVCRRSQRRAQSAECPAVVLQVRTVPPIPVCPTKACPMEWRDRQGRPLQSSASRSPTKSPASENIGPERAVSGPRGLTALPGPLRCEVEPALHHICRLDAGQHNLAIGKGDFRPACHVNYGQVGERQTCIEG